jgi:hypothetical protein
MALRAEADDPSGSQGTSKEDDTAYRLSPSATNLILILGMALLGDFLLRLHIWDINATLWLLALMILAIPINLRKSAILLPHATKYFFIAAAFFACFFALRDAVSVKCLAMMAWSLCLIYGIAILHRFPWTNSGIVAFATEGPETTLYAVTSRMAKEASGDISISSDTASRIFYVIRGLILAVPFLVVFYYLFAMADAQFSRTITSYINIETILNHLARLSMAGLISWSLLAGIIHRDEKTPKYKIGYKIPSIHMNAVEVSIATGLISLLFVLFVSMQFQYLFGGMDYLMKAPSLSAANYARSGFFELILAASLVLGSLYFFDWLSRDSSPPTRRILHWFARVLLVLAAIVLISAIHRLFIYIKLFGLTEMRLLALAVIVWLATLFLWCERTVLCNRRNRFAAGTLVTALLIIALYGAINPHALIAGTHIERCKEGKPLDFNYIQTLSKDALPTLYQSRDSLDEEHWNKLLPGLPDAFHLNSKFYEDWRYWNYGLHRAIRTFPSPDVEPSETLSN